MRGYIFSFDTAFGTLLTVIILWSALWGLSLPTVLEDIQMARLSNDAVDILVEEGIDENAYERMSELLPPHYRFRILQESFHYSAGFLPSGTILLGDELPDKMETHVDIPSPFRIERTSVEIEEDEIVQFNKIWVWVWLK